MGVVKRIIRRAPAFYDRFGWKGLSILLRQKMQPKNILQFTYPKLFKYPIYLRKGSSDFPVFESVLMAGCYDIDYGHSPKVIFDCGANIGLTSVFYANRFPSAKIVAIEPEDANFKLLKKNTENYPNIRLYQNGIWNKSVNLLVEDTGQGSWAFSLREVPDKTPGTVRAISIPELMEREQVSTIDILKIDIEGSEKELFESGYEDWLPKVKTIVIELHDRMRENASLSFFRALCKYNFSLEIKGENLVCFIK
jgi:FkbM family methyltransferase